MSKNIYDTTEAIKAAIEKLEEGDIIEVPQYANALEIEHLGDLNGDTNAFVGVRFADPNKRTSATKTIIVNRNSGIAYLSAGTTDKGAVKEMIVHSDDDDPLPADEQVDRELIETKADPLDKIAEENEAEQHHEPERDAWGRKERMEVEGPGDFPLPRGDPHIAPGEIVTDAGLLFARFDPMSDEEKAEIDAELAAETRTFEDEYEETVEHTAEVIIEELEADMGEDFAHVSRGDLPSVADELIHDTVDWHEYTSESRHYIPVIDASPTDPDHVDWQTYVDFHDRPSASEVLGAMAYVVFKQDIIDALRGEFDL